MIVANYDAKWEYLSKEHERIDNEIQQTLENYKNGRSLKSFAFAILGTYGIGKTQLLYQIHKYSIEKEIIPLYFLAEDLFTSIVATIYPADKKDFRFLNSSSLSNSNRRTLSLSHGISKFD